MGARPNSLSGTDHRNKRGRPAHHDQTWVPGTKHPEPAKTGIVCACGMDASQFGTRREFNTHRQVCT